MTKRVRPDRPRVSIVVPAMNEARNLEVVLPQLPADAEIVLVDGHSVDDTVAVTRRLVPDAVIVHQTRRGKGNALVCGFERARGDIVVMFDADGSADPREIPSFVKALTDGADFAKGSRFRPGGGSEDITRVRKAGNFGLNTLANTMMGTKYTDLCYGYNAFWRDILGELNLPDTTQPTNSGSGMKWGDGFEIETVLTCRVAVASLLVTEVPSFELLRIHGLSNLNAISDGVRVLRTIGTERRRSRDRLSAQRAERRRRTQVEALPAGESADLAYARSSA